jgi:hypothetical protein
MTGLAVGITGTVEGSTTRQLVVLNEVLRSFTFLELHHGDAVGVDAESHGLVRRIQFQLGDSASRPRIVLHPPVKNGKRAFCQDADEEREPFEYLERDQNIVDEIDVLIAVPKDAEEQLRSGTWATVRYARKRKTVLIIRINPDGTVRFG